LKKGPDFKSRLHGTLNVLGPNPRQRLDGHVWEDDPSDVYFPVRRAVLLRSLLGLMSGKHQADRLEMDAGLLSALLETGHYTYGSRSFEKIVTALQAASARGFHRSALPPDEVLTMNVTELDDFKRALDQPLAFQKHADEIAAAIHARWMDVADRGNAFRVAFDALDEEQKNDNRAAAWRMPTILGLVGLEFVPLHDPRDPAPDAADILNEHLEFLADEEHRGWMAVRIANGWRRIDRTSDSALKKQHRATRMHDCLVPYAELSKQEKDKDRQAIQWYPDAATLVNFKIVGRVRPTSKKARD
jgi:hypothetical protein